MKKGKEEGEEGRGEDGKKGKERVDCAGREVVKRKLKIEKRRCTRINKE